MIYGNKAFSDSDSIGKSMASIATLLLRNYSGYPQRIPGVIFHLSFQSKDNEGEWIRDQSLWQTAWQILYNCKLHLYLFLNIW